MANNKRKVSVVLGEDEQQAPLEIMQSAIIEIASFGKKINSSRLNRRAICLLITDCTKVPMGEVGKVLDAMEQLEDKFLKRKAG